MASCEGSYLDLKPSETWGCFKQGWKTVTDQVGSNIDRMGADADSTTIGQWLEIAAAIFTLPAVLALYILPVMFLVTLIQRKGFGRRVIETQSASRTQLRWAVYMVISGIIHIVVSTPPSTFLAWHGFAEIACGIAIWLLGPLWWCEVEKRETVA